MSDSEIFGFVLQLDLCCMRRCLSLMARIRARNVLSAPTIKCPYCVKPEKWCKNLSGLTQHINTIHIALLRAPSPPSTPEPQSSPTSPGLAGDDESWEQSGLGVENATPLNGESPTRSPRTREVRQPSDSCDTYRDYHPFLNGTSPLYTVCAYLDS